MCVCRCRPGVAYYLVPVVASDNIRDGKKEDSRRNGNTLAERQRARKKKLKAADSGRVSTAVALIIGELSHRCNNAFGTQKGPFVLFFK